MSVNISKVQVLSFDNEKITFDHFKGDVLLIVNVASKCGFTKQYKALQSLQDKYESKGFRVLGFPCNDFGNQEPGELEEIKNSVQYPMEQISNFSKRYMQKAIQPNRLQH